MPVFSGQPSTLATVTLQQVPSKVRSTDDFMSLLGLPVKQPTASLSVDRMLTVESNKSIDRNTRVDVEFQDDNIEDLIGLVANDLCK